VEGLRVVGISTWPLSPGSAPSATVYAVAEKVSVVSVVAEKSEKSMLMNKLGCRYD
jgi:choline dehydrogenase-like flavoprotein